MSNPDAKTLTRMQKLLNLARQGFGGEAENAERFLAKLLKKHGLTIEEIDNEAQTRVECAFKYRDSDEKTLITQIFSKVLDTETFTYFAIRGKKTLYIELTPAERAEVEIHFSVLLPALKRHMKRSFHAFVVANKLHPTPRNSDDGNQISVDEAFEALMIMRMSTAAERPDVRRAIELRPGE